MKRSRIALTAAALWAAFSLPAQAQSSSRANFIPQVGAGITISATTTSAGATLPGVNQELYIMNSGTDLVFCRWGAGAQTATTADIPIPTGAPQIFGSGLPPATGIACIANATTATVRIIPGNGGYH